MKVITSNPAKAKGNIIEGHHADLVLLQDDTLEIHTVIAMGKIMVDKGELIVFGTFEKEI